MVRVQGL